MSASSYQMVVIGASAGALNALRTILKDIPDTFPLAILIVQHISDKGEQDLIDILKSIASLPVLPIEDKSKIKNSTIYVAPANYHLLIEKKGQFSLSVDSPVHFARPSIDVCFESAANIYQDTLIGILLTGANTDGAKGLSTIETYKGMVIVQDPTTAEAPTMPQAGLEATHSPHVLPIEDISAFLIKIVDEPKQLDDLDIVEKRESNQEKPPVLVVDDRDENIKAIKGILKDLSCDLISCSLPNKVIDLCLKYDFSCILLDVQMPGMNGFEVANQLKQNKKTAAIPIIFISAAYQSDDHILKGYKIGAVDYLLKPVNPAIIQSKVDVFNQLYLHHRRLEQLKNQLHKLACIDPMTGVFNRRYFDVILNKVSLQAKKKNQSFVLFLLDIDNFKHTNDVFGHTIGDALLKQVAQAIPKSVDELNYTARIGGDEFAIIFPETLDKTKTYSIAKHLISTLSKPYRIERYTIPVSISIGIAMYAPDDEKRALLKNVDIALYKAKAKGESSFQYFTEKLHKAFERRNAIELALSKAIEKNEFHLHYQPRVDMVTGKIAGAEVLLRWNSENLGTVSPAEFIPVIENVGMMEKVGWWIIKQACAQFARLKEETSYPLRLAINISPLQLENPNFVENVISILNRYNISIDEMEFELTESAFDGLNKKLEDALLKINEANIPLSIDDFGTGYSSLFRLTSLPIQILKIDCCFISKIGVSKGDESVIKSILNLAEALDLEVIAEGIETQEQADFLKDCGNIFAQGFFYYKPMPLQDLLDILTSSS